MLPSRGTVFVYGRLSNQACSNIQPLDLIYRKKKFEGFMLTNWIMAGGSVSMYMRMRQATAVVHEGLTPPSGWARSQFVDCSLSDMHSKFLELNEKGFTGSKLRILIQPEQSDGTVKGNV